MLTVHHKVNFGLQTMATFSQSEQCYVVLEQLFSPTFIYKFELPVLLIPSNHLKNLEEPE